MIRHKDIARVCHEVNRVYCQTTGDHSQLSWDDAPDWQQQSAIDGVKYAIENEPNPAEQHQAWLKDKIADGWHYGPVKDAQAKTHPCMLPYEELPKEQRLKDFFFVAVVRAFIKIEE